MFQKGFALTRMGSKKCIDCNLEYSAKYRFCTECGKELKINNTCPGCNSKLVKASKFCPDCGLKVSQDMPINTHFINPETKSKIRFNNENLIILLWSIPIISFAYSNFIIDITLGTDIFYLFLVVELFMIVALARNNKDLYKISILILIGKQALLFLKIFSQNNFSFNTLMWPIFVFYFIFIPLLIYIYKVNNFNIKSESSIFKSIYPKRLVVTKIIWSSLGIVYFWYLIIAILSSGFVLGISENIVLNLAWNALMATFYFFIKKSVPANKRNQKIIGGLLFIGFILFCGYNFVNSNSFSSLQSSSATASTLPPMNGIQKSRYDRFMNQVTGVADNELKVTVACVSIYYEDWNNNWMAGGERDSILYRIQDCIVKTDSNLFCREAINGSGPVCGPRNSIDGYSLSSIFGTMAALV